MLDQLTNIDESLIGNERLRRLVASLKSEYTQAADKALAESVLGERASQAIKLIEKGFPQAIGKQRTPEAIAVLASQSAFAAKGQMKEKASRQREAVAYFGTASEVTTLRESYDMYNPGISSAELDAYLSAHPESHLNGLFASKSKDGGEYLLAVQKGLLCYYAGKLAYRYEYLSGDIASKLRRLDPSLAGGGQDAEHIVSTYGQDVLTRQLEALMAVRPMNKRIIAENPDDRIVLEPFAETCTQSFIATLNPDAGIHLHEPATIRDAFARWIDALPSSQYPYAEKLGVKENYCYAKPVRLSKADRQDLNEDQAEEQKAQRRERYFDLGRKLFYEFLATAVPREAISALEAKWNERYNSLVQPDYSKIPVAFQFSQTFKAGGPLRLSPAQRDGIAFMKAKRSACLGYDVGVGKTLTALAIISEALDSGRAKRALVVVPDQTIQICSFV